MIMFAQYSLIRLVFMILLLLTQLCLIPACSFFDNKNTIDIQLQASQYLNPDIRGSSEPVLVSIYQLNAEDEFNRLNYFQLQNQNKVNATILDKFDIEIQPKEKINFFHPLHPDTKSIAIVAAFRDLDHSQWKKIIKITPKKKPLLINLSTQSISIKEN